jgi:hypothetical protein
MALKEILFERVQLAKGQVVQQADAAYFAALNLAGVLYGPSTPIIAALNELRKATVAQSSKGEDLAILGRLEERQLAKFQRGVFGCLVSMENDITAGIAGSLESQYQGEIFADFVTAAKIALDQGAKDPAAVLAFAALEDSLKRFAEMNGIDVGGREMQDVINALKGKGFFSGPQKGIVEAFPRLRNAAMHADWSKIQPEDVRSAIGFVEQFLMTRFGAINLPSP